MRRRMATRARKGNWPLMAQDYEEQAAHAESRAAVIRAVLMEEKGQGVNQKKADAMEAEALKAGDRSRGPKGSTSRTAKPPPAPEGQELPGVPAAAAGARRFNPRRRRMGTAATPVAALRRGRGTRGV